MKIQRRTRESGSAILVVLVIGSVLCIMSGSYLTLVWQQNSAVVRSMAWNSCIPVSEAGIEEGITQVYYNGTTNLTANGWVLANGAYSKQRTIGDSYYEVSISS